MPPQSKISHQYALILHFVHQKLKLASDDVISARKSVKDEFTQSVCEKEANRRKEVIMAKLDKGSGNSYTRFALNRFPIGIEVFPMDKMQDWERKLRGSETVPSDHTFSTAEWPAPTSKRTTPFLFCCPSLHSNNKIAAHV